MKIVSFAYTTKEFIDGIKTETRRKWTDDYAKSFKKGEIFQAYDKSPRYGGKLIGYGRVVVPPFKQWLHEMNEQNLKAEGGRWKTVEEFIKVFGDDMEVWVLTFEKCNTEGLTQSGNPW